MRLLRYATQKGQAQGFVYSGGSMHVSYFPISCICLNGPLISLLLLSGFPSDLIGYISLSPSLHSLFLSFIHSVRVYFLSVRCDHSRYHSGQCRCGPCPFASFPHRAVPISLSWVSGSSLLIHTDFLSSTSPCHLPLTEL